MSSPIRRSPIHVGRVVANEPLTPRMRRVSVQAEAMIGLAIRPAQDVELHLLDASGRRVKRRYTIGSSDPRAGTIDLDVLLHGEGPGSNWGLSARPGDAVSFQGPRGKLELSAADWHLLAGDESALPAIASICAALPAGESAIAVIEVQDESDRIDFGPGQVHWVYRGDGAPGTPDHLVPALNLLEFPAGGGHGYLLGETRSMVALRTVLEGRGLAHDAIFVKGYWNIARPDRIAGRRPS